MPSITQRGGMAAAGFGFTGAPRNVNQHIYVATIMGNMTRINMYGAAEQNWVTGLIQNTPNEALSIAVDQSGNIFTCEGRDQSSISKITQLGTVTSNWVSFVGETGNFYWIDTGSFGNVYVGASSGTKIAKITPDGTPNFSWATTTTTGHFCIALDSSNNVYAYNLSPATAISKVTPDATVTSTWATVNWVGNPRNTIAFDGTGTLYGIRYNTGSNQTTVAKIQIGGAVTYPWLTIPGNSNWITANEVTGDLAISVYSTGQVLVYNSSGTNTGTFNVGTNPQNLAIDRSGNLYVVLDGGSITKISTTGIVTQNWSTVNGTPVGIVIY